jgi:phosphate starvation-inducible PhoH-like protein
MRKTHRGRNAQHPAEKEERVIKDKFKEQRAEKLEAKPIFPLNDRQREYFEAIRTKDLIVATGYAGTSKTFVATSLAADSFYKGECQRIVLARPAVSNSQSLGFFAGDLNQKMSVWLMPLLSVLYQRLGRTVVDLAIQEGNIVMQPLETIKGMSYGKGTWVIADEVEDCTIEEIKSIVTRNGGAKMILCGDVLQSALHEKSGLAIFADILYNSRPLQEYATLIEFDSYDYIVRGKLCKSLIVEFDKAGY